MAEFDDEPASKRARLDLEDGAAEEAPQPSRERTIVAPPPSTSKALKSVLKVFTTKTENNYALPWQMRPQRSSTGSAFVSSAKKRFILTNSHVVTNATTIQVRRPGNPRKWRARILCEGRLCDLALLTVDEDEFWADPFMLLQFDEVPQLQDSILVAGYPLGSGSESLSITKGIVSRVVMARYSTAQTSNKLLGVQIDAAINFGNSGGPAFTSLQDGKIGGIAFSKLTSGDNIGYIIPSQVVQHFLNQYEMHGEYRGCCSEGFRWQEGENAHLRSYLQVPADRSGIHIFKVDPLLPAANVLQEGDFLMEVDGVPVADDGTIQFRNEERVEFSHIIRSKYVGDQLKVQVVRKGEVLELAYTLQQSCPLVPALHGVECVPSYFIVAGLVFVPLSIPFLEHAYGTSAWRKLAPPYLLALIPEYCSRPDEQVVLLFQVLAAEINFGYRFSNIRCLSVNGTDINNLAELAKLVDACSEEYLHFGLEGGCMLSLEASAAKRESPNILETHAIAMD
ncbi:hypothetical protein WJX84_008840, partial [Apatococcus fuscideae]